MNELLNVVDQVKAGAEKLEWVTNLAEALERIGSIEQAEREANFRLKARREEEATLNEELEALRVAMKEAADALNLRRSEAKRTFA